MGALITSSCHYGCRSCFQHGLRSMQAFLSPQIALSSLLFGYFNGLFGCIQSFTPRPQRGVHTSFNELVYGCVVLRTSFSLLGLKVTFNTWAHVKLYYSVLFFFRHTNELCRIYAKSSASSAQASASTGFCVGRRTNWVASSLRPAFPA